MRKLYILTSLFLMLFASASMGQTYYLMNTMTVTDNSGYLVDDGDTNGNYVANMVHTFTIDVGAGKTLNLGWQEFDVEKSEVPDNSFCTYDYIEIFNGAATTQPSATMYCGTSLPPNFTVTGGKITVRFTSDGNTEGKGFVAFWTTGSLPPPPTPTYCYASGPPCVDAANVIAAVNLDAITYTNNGINCQDDPSTGQAYSDFTNLVFPVNSGALLQGFVTIQGAIAYELTDIYVDWNNNGSFEDAGEKTTATSADAGGEYVLNVPVGESQGLKRMRVRTWDQVFEVGTATSCGTTAYGEVEDYSVLYSDPSKPLPPCALNESPSNADTICSTAVLSWSLVTDATSYLVTVKEKSGNVVLSDSSTTGTSMDVTSKLTADTRYQYIVKPVNANGTAMGCDTNEFHSAIAADPTASIIPSISGNICSNQAFAVDGNPSGGTTPYSHQWTALNGSIFTSPSSQTSDVVLTTGKDTLIYRVTDNNGCQGIDSLEINVVPGVTAGTLSSENTNICENSSAVLDYTMNQGETIQWQDSVTGGTWSNQNAVMASGNKYTTPALSENTSYRAIVTSLNGCSDTTNTIDFTSIAPPAKPTVTATPQGPYCEGENVVLTALSTDEITWNTTPETTGPVLVVTESGSYIATATNLNGCSTSSDPFDVNFEPKPATPDITRTSSGPICEGSPEILTSSYSTGNTWSTGSSNQSIVVSTDGDYSVFYTSPEGCISDEASITLNFNPIPNTPAITQNGNDLTASPGNSFRWFGPDGQELSVTSPTFTATDGGNYSAIAISPEGCASDTSAPFRFSGVGIKEISGETILIFPIPSSGLINFSIPQEIKSDYTVSVNTIDGKTLFFDKIKFNTDQLDLSTVPNGIFIIRLEGDKFLTQRIISISK